MIHLLKTIYFIKKIFNVLIFIVCASQAFAQTIKSARISSQIDSLEKCYRADLLGAEKKLNQYIIDLKDSHDPVIFKAYTLFGLIKKYQGHFDESLRFHEKTIAGRRRLHDQEGLAISYIDIASTYMRMSEYELAFKYVDSCIVLAKSSKSPEAIVKGRLILGNLWQYEIGNHEKALVNYRSGLRTLKVYKSLKLKGALNTGIANIYSFLDVVDSVMCFYRPAITAYNKAGYDYGVFITYENMGVFMLDNNILDSAEYYLLKAKEKNKTLDLVDEDAVLAINLNQLYIAKNEQEKGFEILRAELKSTENLSLDNIQRIHSGISEYFEFSEQFDSALYYYKLYNFYRDSVNKSEQFLKITELEAKYNNERLRAEKLEAVGISEKAEAENKILMLAAIILASLFLLAGFGVLLLRQKLHTKTLLAEKNEVIHQQRLNELVREKQIERMSALMEGQEKERTRVARELHDSIGTLLATLKHHFQLIESQLGENDEKYHKAYSLLDKASSEVRRISHNIASNVLSKFGLVAALQDLAEEITSAEKTSVKVFAVGLDNRLENSIEIHLFRVVQELVTNALKHAKASEISIQFTMHDHELNLIVEDNGIGFDLNTALTTKGMGMENLKARVTHLKGDLEIDSSPGKGTTIIVNVPIV